VPGDPGRRAALQGLLGQAGLAEAGEAQSADVVILNTCTVTAAADEDVRKSIHRVHRENPAARILVTGCYAQRAPEELAGLPGVAWVVGNSHKPGIPELIRIGTAPAARARRITGRSTSAISAPRRSSFPRRWRTLSATGRGRT